MSNIFDYLDWRGDIPFSVDPFNEVDNLVLADLVYTDFDGIVPGEDTDDYITIEEACERYFALHTEEEIMARASSVKTAGFLMPKMAHSKRFGGMKLKWYVNDITMEDQSQFAAATFVLNNGQVYVAFRGTDNTVIGWKEDFHLSFMAHTPGQQAAAAYLNGHFAHYHHPILIGGHSKGGNLSVYAGAFCDPKVKKHIDTVYSNDGPGFRENVLDSEEYKAILPKVVSIIPETSIVGMLLGNDLDHTVVLSSNQGAMAHDGTSWQVLGNHFVVTDSVDATSMMTDQTLKLWLNDLDDEVRKEFVDALFEPLCDEGVVTIDDIAHSKFKTAFEMMKKYAGMDPDKQKILAEILLKLIYSGSETVKTNMALSAMQRANEFQERLQNRFHMNQPVPGDAETEE